MIYEDNNIIEDFMGRLKELKDYPINFPQYLEINCQLFYSALIKENVPKYHTAFNIATKEFNVNTMGTLRFRPWADQEYGCLFDYLLKSCEIHLGHSTLQPDGSITTFLIDKNGEQLARKPFKNNS